MRVDSRKSAFARKPGQRPLILAHRGARRSAPENTLKAFEVALEQGADGVELDVRMAADGQLFVCHDDAIALENGEIVQLEDLTSSQIRALNTRSGEPVPSLREALAFSARTGALLNVELKGNVRAPLALAREAARQIAIHGGSGLLLSSFHVGQVALLSRSLAELPVALLVHDAQAWLPRLMPLSALDAVALHPQDGLVDQAFLNRCRRRQALVNVWTVNDATRARQLAIWGVDGLITDLPKLLRTALDP